MLYFFYHHIYITWHIVDGSINPGPHFLRSEIDNALEFDKDDEYFVGHAEVFAAAVKYYAPELRKLTAQKFREAFEAAAWFILKADLDRSRRIFGQAIPLVYSSTPSEVGELRDHLKAEIKGAFKGLKVKYQKPLETTMPAEPGLYYDVLIKAVQVVAR